MHPHVRNFLDVSTAHIRPETYQGIVKRSFDSLNVLRGEYSLMIFAPKPDEIGMDVPEDLRCVFIAARNAGCDYVMFDHDGPIARDLPDYSSEWEWE